ncbi:MAG: holo-ACP synthase [Clostridia bacterium]|nr:holo-ACP synthase [Clostridia bacterium]
MSKIIGIGTDMCAVSRMEKAIERAHFYERVFFEEERAYLEKKENARAQSAAAMFAAKEAVSKALGTGFIRGIMPWTIEVTHDEAGKPGVNLHGAAKERLEAIGGQDVHLSLTHEGDTAMAFVIIEG